jgi:hypothetical protein
MISVTISENGAGVVELPGRPVKINAPTVASARAEAIETLVSYSATSAVSIDVEAHDLDDVVRLSVHPYGQVVVHRDGEPAPNDIVGPDLAPLPQETPDLYEAGAPRIAVENLDEADAVPAPTTHATGPGDAGTGSRHGDDSTSVQQAPARAEDAPAALGGSLPASMLRENPAPPLDDDLDMTRIMRRSPMTPAAVLEFTSGEVLTVTGVALVGRAPAAKDGEEFDDIFAIDDPARTVSKTHFAAGWHEGEFTITDRHSGNGTVIHHHGHAITLQPGAAHTVADGDRVDIGDQSFNVRIDTGKNL